MLALVLDGAIAILVLVALGFGLRLQRTLRGLRSDDGELERLIVALDAASERAADALAGLKQAAASTDERLAAALARAQRLVDDLQFLTSRGEQLADRLEEQISNGRPPAQCLQPPPPTAAIPCSGVVPDRADQADLERALRTLR